MEIKNLIVGQSGGPTAVINSSLYGVVSEALSQPSIGKVYGMVNGIEGFLRETVLDFEETLFSNDLEKLKAYALYSGMKNYRNLFLYANGILTGKTDIELPDPMYWSAIYHPKAKTVYTDLAAYKKIFAMLQNRLLVFYFIVTNGYGVTWPIKRH